MAQLSLVGLAGLAALLATPPAVRAGDQLPGSSVPLQVALAQPIDFAAVSVADGEPALGDIQGDTRSVTQHFRLLGLVVGRTGGAEAGEMRYEISADGSERTVHSGERVIWLARCREKTWEGVHVVADTPENRLFVYTASLSQVIAQAPDAVWIRIQIPGDAFAPGQSIPVSVQLDNTSEAPLTLWSNFSALQFDVLAEDGEPLTCRRPCAQRFDRSTPLVVQQYRGPVETADLASLCNWLPSGDDLVNTLSNREVRSYTLLWHAKVRLDDRKAEPVEVVADPIRLTVRDPRSLAWGVEGEGAGSDGVACGLAAERTTAPMGERVIFQFGLRSDSLRVDTDLFVYRYCNLDDVTLTFRNAATGTVYQRSPDDFQGGPLYSPKAEDFLRLRDHPVYLWTVPVRLLHPSGEQIPPGTYEVTASYAPRVAEGSSWDSAPRKWDLCRGPLVSGPVFMRVESADPESVEIRTNSAIELKLERGTCWWTGSQENPTILRVTTRPGFCFRAEAETNVAVGDGEFHRASSGGFGGRIVSGPLVSLTWGTGFLHYLGPDACRALAAGDPLRVRVDVTIYETANPNSRSFFPGQGDTRVVWRGSLEAHRP